MENNTKILNKQKTTDEKIRLDIFVAKQFPNISRAKAKTLIKDGFVLVNGRKSKSCNNVNLGDNIQITIIPEKPKEVKLLPIDIVFEDEDILIINKQKGMSVHSGVKNFVGTLVGELKKRNLVMENGQVGIIHRLDKDTCGLMVFAKTLKAFKGLSKQIEQGKIERKYKALVCGNLRPQNGEIKTYIKINNFDRRKMEVARTGQIAITLYKVLEHYNGYDLVEYELKTGRTHQIRVHSLYKKCPLVGDKLYDAPKNNWGINGQMLQSYFIKLIHPILNTQIQFTIPLNEEFEKVINEIKKFK